MAATVERSISSLKIVKNYFRSRVEHTRKVEFPIMSIEKRLLDESDTEKLISVFSKLKTKKVNLK